MWLDILLGTPRHIVSSIGSLAHLGERKSCKLEVSGA
jgi:hypothetical protein